MTKNLKAKDENETGFEPKYCLSDMQEFVKGHAVRRIFALRDFSNVREGDMGGYMESEDNLSHEGDCWIYDDAMAVDKARVRENARLTNNAVAQDQSVVKGNAVVGDNATVADWSVVKGNARLFDQAATAKEAVVMGNAKIGGQAVISGMSVVGGDSIVAGLTTLAGVTELDWNAEVSCQSVVRKNGGKGRKKEKLAFFSVPEALPGTALEAWLDPEDLTPRFSIEGVGRDMELDDVKEKAFAMADLMDARTLMMAARFAATVMQKELDELRSERRRKVRD